MSDERPPTVGPPALPVEVTAELAGEWMQIPAYVEELEQLAGKGAPADLLAQVRAAERDSVPLARELFSRWPERVVGLDGDGPSR